MSTPITNEDLRNLVLQQGQTPGSNVPASFRPIRPTRPIPPAATLRIPSEVDQGSGLIPITIPN